MNFKNKYEIVKYCYENSNFDDKEKLWHEGYLQGLYEGKMITLEQRNKLNKILRKDN
jgi:hypothetical protein